MNFISIRGQVFDGHGGTDAASFVRKNILKFIVEDSHFPLCVQKAIKSAFVKADHAFADASSLDISSGTTALTAFIFGRSVSFKAAFDSTFCLLSFWGCDIRLVLSSIFIKKLLLALTRFCSQHLTYLCSCFGFS